MKRRGRSRNRRQGFLHALIPPRSPQPDPEGRETSVEPPEKGKSGHKMRRVRAEVHGLLESAFGLVPSFLKRPKDAIALFDYKPLSPDRSR